MYLPQCTKQYEMQMVGSKRIKSALLFLQIGGTERVTGKHLTLFAEVGGGTPPKMRALRLLQLGR